MNRLLIAAASLALGLPLAATADPGHGKGHGRDHDNGPPGWAGDGARHGNPHGMPPGQAKKMWRRGERLPVVYAEPRYYVRDYRSYRLPPPPPRYRYVIVEDRVYVVDPTTRLIRDVIDILAR